MNLIEIFPYLTVLGSVIDFVFSVIVFVFSVIVFVFTAFQYIDTRKVENETRRFEQYHRIFEWMAGRTESGRILVDTQQAVAVYELAHFPEYSEMTLPIIDYYLKKTEKDPGAGLFRSALSFADQKLRPK